MSRNKHIISHDSSKQDRNIGARKKNFSETILAAMIDEWTVFWRAPEEKQNDYFIPTEDERKFGAYQFR